MRGPIVERAGSARNSDGDAGGNRRNLRIRYRGAMRTATLWCLVLAFVAGCAAKPAPESPAPESPAPIESLYRGEVSERLAQGFDDESGTWLRIESGVETPQLRRRVSPEYTDDALDRKIEGTVLLEVVILKSGRVGAVRVLRSLDAGLDAKAVAAVREWTFLPARFQGVAVDVLVEIEIDFRLL